MIKLPLTFLLEISKGLLDVTTINGSHCLFICRYKNLITLVDISNLSVHTIYSGDNCGLVLDVEYQEELLIGLISELIQHAKDNTKGSNGLSQS